MTTRTKLPISDIAFTGSVKQAQKDRGSRELYAKVEARGGWQDRVNPDLAAFIGERDSLYLGTSNAAGQPYIQHRGGSPGFLKVLDDRTLALADFSGNRQYISLGNLEDNDKAFIFLMDYPNRRRVKIWGTARFVENDPALLTKLVDPSYPAEPERALVFTIDAWDSNCPQHITPRFAKGAAQQEIRQLRNQVQRLESENARLRRTTQPAVTG
jgi:predicted pyridoxine 5'-phosphate oxidase superfamily flavin-nucleotide-binding protein